jgi:hypothetical protein
LAELLQPDIMNHSIGRRSADAFRPGNFMKCGVESADAKQQSHPTAAFSIY